MSENPWHDVNGKVFNGTPRNGIHVEADYLFWHCLLKASGTFRDNDDGNLTMETRDFLLKKTEEFLMLAFALTLLVLCWKKLLDIWVECD